MIIPGSLRARFKTRKIDFFCPRIIQFNQFWIKKIATIAILRITEERDGYQ